MCTGGELAVALRGRLPGRADRAARQQQVGRPSCARGVDAGVGRIVVDSFDEIDRLAGCAVAARRRASGCWSGSPSASRRTPTSSSPPRTRTRSSASRSPAATRSRPCAGCSRAPGLRAGRAALAHRLADLRHRRLRGRRAPGGRAARADPRRARRRAAGARPRRRLRHRLHQPTTTRSTPPTMAAALRAIVDARVRGGRAAPCRGSRSSRAGRSSGPATSRSTRSARSSGRSTGAAHLRLRRRRHERQHPHRALRRRLHRASLASRRPTRRRCWPGSSGKHCESGDIVVKDACLPADVAPGDLLAVAATGAYCRSMASNYNHVPRPPVVAVARRRGPGRACAARPRTTCSRWTSG